MVSYPLLREATNEESDFAPCRRIPNPGVKSTQLVIISVFSVDRAINLGDLRWKANSCQLMSNMPSQVECHRMSTQASEGHSISGVVGVTYSALIQLSPFPTQL